jgi:hypothetical protein
MLRGLLLPPEPSVRDLGDRSVPDFPAGASRRAPAPEPASLRVPPGAQDAGGVGIPLGERAGCAPRMTAVRRDRRPHPARGRVALHFKVPRHRSARRGSYHGPASGRAL